MNQLINTLLIFLCWTVVSAAQSQVMGTAPKSGQVWNEMTGEKLEVLQLKGDAARGAEAFQVCQGCHKRGAIGTPSGTYPRLAGQHATVLIEQITDIRSGRRVNPKMAPFSDEHLLSTQEIADIAIYLQNLPIQTQQIGLGSGNALGRGKELYVKDCTVCHGERGEGLAQKFVPMVAGQHFKYLQREAGYIRDGLRGNANPDMVKVIKAYRDEDLDAVCDYISRLPVH